MTSSTPSFRNALREARRDTAPGPTEGFPIRVLAWLALAPSWPLELALRAFPVDHSGPPDSETLEERLNQIVQARLAHRDVGDKSYPGPWYWMDDAQQSLVLQDLLQRRRMTRDDLLRELHEAASAVVSMADPAFLEQNSPLSRWSNLVSTRQLEDNLLEAMAERLGNRVGPLLESAREAGQLAVPEARQWIASAKPLGRIFGGALNDAVTRAQQQLEIYHHEARNEQYLANYLTRDEQDEALGELLNDDSPEWALHVVGGGGMGKTMFIRHLKSRLARKENLATSSVDFDNLHPDYPSLAPGLLLMAFSEELRIGAPSVAKKKFKDFDGAVSAEHRDLRGTASESFQLPRRNKIGERPLQLFIDALEIISKERRPLLILDTCEELARIRPDGTVPESVDATFDVLEAIHKNVPLLRVLFCGRRRLPHRDWLRVNEIHGFTRGEALTFLDRYRGEERGVPHELHTLILERSVVSDEKSTHRLEVPRDARVTNAPDNSDNLRYNPYDVDMYAAMSSGKERLTLEQLRNASPHAYIQERIVNRVASPIRKWLPLVAELGRFDRKLLWNLLGRPAENFDKVFAELIDQEWVGNVPFSQRNDFMWAIDSIARDRLRRYYREAEPIPGEQARQQIAEALPRLTLAEEFPNLVPEYFQLALDLLRPHADRVLAWWQSVEQRLAAEQQWEFGLTLTSSLIVDPIQDSKATDSETTELLRCGITATRAAIQGQRGDAKEALACWQSVAATLQHRASDGAAAPLWRRAVRGGLANLSPKEIFTRVDLLEHMPLIGPARSMVRQEPWQSFDTWFELPVVNDAAELASEIACIENAVESLESIVEPDLPAALPVDSWVLKSDDRQRLEAFLDKLQARLGGIQLQPALTGAESAVCLVLSVRVRRMTHGQASDALLLRAIHLADQSSQVGDQTSRRPCSVDWRMPADLPARLRLEFIRLMRLSDLDATAKGMLLAELPAWTATSWTIDADRLAAARLIAARDQGELLAAHEADVDASARIVALPSCRSHVAFPPLFVAAWESRAALQGEVEKAVKALVTVREVKPLPHVLNAIDCALMRLAIRHRLANLPVLLKWTISQADPWESYCLRLTLKCYLFAIDLPPEDVQLPGNTYVLHAAIKHLELRANRSQSEPIHPDVGLGLSLSLRLDQQERSRLRDPFVEDFIYVPSLELKPVPELVLHLRFAALFPDSHHVPRRLSERAGKIGLRRAAEIAFDEAGLLGLRRPAEAVFLFQTAQDWFERANCPSDAFFSAVGRALLHTRRLAWADLAGALRDAERLYARCRELCPDLPEDVDGLNLKAILNATTDSEGPEIWGWAPWLVRWVACRSRAAGAHPMELKLLLQNLYPQGVPADLQAVKAMSWPVRWLENAILWTELPGALVVLGLLVTTILFAARGEFAYAGATGAGFLGIGLLWGWLFSRNERSRKLLKKHSPEPKDELGSAITTRARRIEITPLWISRGQTQGKIVSGSYRDQALEYFGKLRPEFRSRLESVLNSTRELPKGSSGASPPPAERFLYVVLKLDECVQSTPWEALFSLHTQPRTLSDIPIRFRRVVTQGRTGERPDKPFPGPLHVVTWCADPVGASWASMAWGPVARQERLFQYSLGLKGRQSTRIGYLHMLGAPRQDSLGTHWAFVSKDSPDGASQPEIVRPETVAGSFPWLRLCILQELPGEEPSRYDSDRDVAGMMREFASSLARLGVPAVITLPCLPQTVAIDVVSRLADSLVSVSGAREDEYWMGSLMRVLVNAGRYLADQETEPPDRLFPRGRRFGGAQLATAARKIQERIATADPNNPDAALERALDVCVYAVDDLNLQVNPPDSQEASPPAMPSSEKGLPHA